MTVIGFGYKKHSGKDTAAEVLVNHFSYKNFGFGDPIKEVGKDVFHFSDQQCDGDKKTEVDEFWGVSPARLFQIIGTELFRERLTEILPEQFDRDVWIRSMERRLEKHEGDHVTISDVRFPNEAEMLKQKFGATLCLIDTPKEDRLSRGGKEDSRSEHHPSECALDGWDGWDLVIDNSGSLKEFETAVKSIGFNAMEPYPMIGASTMLPNVSEYNS